MNVSLSGQLVDFDLPQIITVLEVSRLSGRLEATSPDGEGTLLFAGGY